MNKTGMKDCNTDTKRKIGVYFAGSPDGVNSKPMLCVTQEYIDTFSNLSDAEKSFCLLVSKEAMILRNREDAYSKLLEILAPHL